MKQVSSPKRAKKKLLWGFAGAIGLISVLLYFEQIAVIYVLSTLGLVALLLIVALSDLEKPVATVVKPELPIAIPPAESEKKQSATAGTTIRKGG